MDRHPARTNRTGLIALGVVLLGAGGVGLARGAGLFGDETARVLSPGVRAFAEDNAWFWPVIAAAAVLLALLGLLWLIGQLRTHRVPALSMEPDPHDGKTRLSAKAVTGALEREIEEYPGVRRVRARLLGSSRRPELRLNVTYGQRADPAELRRRIQEEGVPRLCAALERETVPTVVRLRLVPREEPTTVV
ncbi:alkaline shock response membrane anchor protein AmaP [Actinomadura sp. WMMB 499]|uniref:alkaline shock response membrane anchor protein AmaP n=1 Tax=Actinomadura sp. WMMB 499 TaxID=1219491 RepID=UPI001244DA85|nr:alkaline shock response membrane anchor protein AmaP [Actinomadura sp. WMMB 499]QFG24347.1 alkaline shock response membrane anchor protein AmaP [Actinomadura sp. WMMB 499]